MERFLWCIFSMLKILIGLQILLNICWVWQIFQTDCFCRHNRGNNIWTAMTGLYEEGHNTQPWSDRPNTINCAVSYIILHLYDLHQSNLGRGTHMFCGGLQMPPGPSSQGPTLGSHGPPGGPSWLLKPICAWKQENKINDQNRRLFPWAATCCKCGSMGCWFISMLGSSMFPSPANEWIIYNQ